MRVQAEIAGLRAAVAAGPDAPVPVPTALTAEAELDELVAKVVSLEEQLHVAEAGRAQPKQRGNGGQERSARARARPVHLTAASADDDVAAAVSGECGAGDGWRR